MTIQSYKIPSRIWTAVSFLAAFIVYIGKDGLAQIIPGEYAYIIPIIVLIAGYIATQKSEEKRVNVAEQLVHEQYNDPTAEEEFLEDDVVGEEDDI